jgi:hypothetical protein
MSKQVKLSYVKLLERITEVTNELKWGKILYNELKNNETNPFLQVMVVADLGLNLDPIDILPTYKKEKIKPLEEELKILQTILSLFVCE